VELTLSDDQIERYSRHIILENVGVNGQQTLLASKVLIIGAGGLGAPASLYLAAAGVGTLGLVDADQVDLSNLQRQVIHHTADVGRNKVESAANKLRAINPDVTVHALHMRVEANNILDLIEGYDFVIDVHPREGRPARVEISDTFAVMGWSMGGQYAAALAVAMPARVTRLAIIAGALPLTEPGVFARLPVMDRAYTRLSQRSPSLARMCFRTMGFTARAAPSLYGKLAAAELGPADGKVLRDEGFDVFARMSAEALRRPDGVVEDYRAWIRPWGFTPEQVAVPADVWAGENDQLVDADWQRELAGRMKDATLHTRPGGHFMAHLHYQEIFEHLTR